VLESLTTPAKDTMSSVVRKRGKRQQTLSYNRKSDCAFLPRGNYAACAQAGIVLPVFGFCKINQHIPCFNKTRILHLTHFRTSSGAGFAIERRCKIHV
jgi:hypothetical protein